MYSDYLSALLANWFQHCLSEQWKTSKVLYKMIIVYQATLYGQHRIHIHQVEEKYINVNTRGQKGNEQMKL